jgi:photosystem II stability/assembly factor-like uncharacterized protein
MAQQRRAPAVVFAGVTQWRGGADQSQPTGTLGGVFRMMVGNGGWEQLRNGLPQPAQIFCLTVHPTHPAIVYAGAQEGLFRSADGGDHWERLDLDAAVFAVTVHPTQPRTILAGVAPVGVWRSDDGGDTWRRMPRSAVPDRLTCDAFPNRVMRIAVDPSRPDEMYAAMEVNGVARSRDGGESWEDCAETLVRFADRPEYHNKILTQSPAEGMLDAHAVCVSPARPGRVTVANRIGLFRSEDEGETWRDLEMKRFSPITYGRDVRVSPHDPEVLYACLSIASQSTAGSLYRSRDGGETWRRFDQGVEPASTMMAVAPHPADPDTVFCNTRLGQVFGTEDGGRSWQEYRLPAGCRAVMALACA